MDGRPHGIQMTQFRVLAGVRELPHSFGVGNGVGNPKDFGKIVRSRSLKCVRARNRQTPSPYFENHSQ